MGGVINMHSSALIYRLKKLFNKLRRHNKHLILCGSHTALLMTRTVFFERVGKQNVVANLNDCTEAFSGNT